MQPFGFSVKVDFTQNFEFRRFYLCLNHFPLLTGVAGGVILAGSSAATGSGCQFFSSGLIGGLNTGFSSRLLKLVPIWMVCLFFDISRPLNSLLRASYISSDTFCIRLVFNGKAFGNQKSTMYVVATLNSLAIFNKFLPFIGFSNKVSLLSLQIPQPKCRGLRRWFLLQGRFVANNSSLLRFRTLLAVSQPMFFNSVMIQSSISSANSSSSTSSSSQLHRYPYTSIS